MSTPLGDLYRLWCFISSVLQYAEVETVLHTLEVSAKERKRERSTFWDVEREEFLLIPLKLFSFENY